jgi:hypothetical protein
VIVAGVVSREIEDLSYKLYAANFSRELGKTGEDFRDTSLSSTSESQLSQSRNNGVVIFLVDLATEAVEDGDLAVIGGLNKASDF